MRLTLGTRSVDLTTRALVVGPPGPQAPDIVELTMTAGGEGEGRAGHRPASRPFAARVDSSVAAAAALEAGAVLVSSNHSGTSPTDIFPACARAGAAVVVGAPADQFESVRARLVDCARLAEAAGIPCERIVLEPPLTPTLLPHLRRFAELGYPVLLTVTEPVLAALPVHSHAAAVALAVIDGARLIRTDAVKAATRVCRVVSAILEAR